MKKIYLFLASVMVLLLAGSVSAALCKDDTGYYIDCNKVNSNNAPFNHRYEGPSDKSSASYYNYNSGGSSDSDNSEIVPIFKGPYGNYRYQMYANGDYRPELFFRHSGYDSYSYPFFGGYYGSGYGGYPFYSGYGYSGYPSYGGYGYGFGYSNRYGGYYNSYYPVYYSVPFFHVWF